MTDGHRRKGIEDVVPARQRQAYTAQLLTTVVGSVTSGESVEGNVAGLKIGLGGKSIGNRPFLDQRQEVLDVFVFQTEDV